MHIKRRDIGRGLTAPIRIRRKNKICERLPNHFSIAFQAIIPSTKHTPLHFVYLVYFVVKIILAPSSNTGRRPAMRNTEALEAYGPHGRVSPKLTSQKKNSLRVLQTRGNDMAFTTSFICEYYTISNHEIRGRILTV